MFRRFCVSALAALIFLLPTSAFAQSTQIYWGSYVTNAPYYPSLIDQFEADAGKRESIVHWGQPWIFSGQPQVFQTAEAEAVRLRGSIPMINWNSWKFNEPDVDGHGFGPGTITLAQVYNGDYDAYITQWATAAKAWGHPFFLRFDHELNGYWYPWNESMNGNHPGDYVKAWRHVHDLFTQVGATNVTWVWCINLEDQFTTPIAGLYPGDSYVDWTSFDSYNNSTPNPSSWLTPNQVFGYNPWGHHNTYQDLLTVAPLKPIMIAETATNDDGGDPAAWIKDALLTQLPRNFPRIGALVWYNPEYEHAIEAAPSKQAAFKASIASTYYATNTFTNLPPGPIKPLGSTRVLMDVGDDYVDGALPDSTAGGPSLVLLAGGNPYRVPFIRFDLSSVSGQQIISATLRVRTSTAAGSGSVAPFAVNYVASNQWYGNTMSMNNSVPISNIRLGTLTAPQPGTWYSTPIAVSALQGKTGLVSMAIQDQQTSDTLSVYSKEGDPANTPQLVVTVGS